MTVISQIEVKDKPHVGSAKLQEVKWDAFILDKIATLGEYLSQQPFPPPQLLIIDGYNRSMLVEMAVTRLLQDVTHIPVERIKAYATAHFEHRDGDRYMLYFRPQSYVAIDEIAKYLESLPVNDRPPNLRATRSYNRQLIITLALCHAADLATR